jgi:nucleoside-diphosphate-sugar epimerase
MGARGVVLDALDRTRVIEVLMEVRPEVIVHEMTSLGEMKDLKNFDQEFAITNQLRTEGAENLLAGAQQAGVRHFVAQSYAGWPNARGGSAVKTEEDPLEEHPPAKARQTLAAIRTLERLVVEAHGMSGVVLRYGSFYGPGTSLGEGGAVVGMVRDRKFPVVGSGAGVWSFIHVRDAAAATKLAIECAPRGIYNIVDDEPAPVSVWLPELAATLGAKPPMRIPAWIGRLLIGDVGLFLMEQSRGSSNAKAKRVLGWLPQYSSWREGFRNGLSAERNGRVASAVAVQR